MDDHPAEGSGPPCDPVVVDDWMTAAAAIDRLIAHQQSIAFVVTNGHLSAIVTFHDLEFAGEWAGPGATVADAATCGLVDVAAGSSPSEAAKAFSEAAARWLEMARVRTHRPVDDAVLGSPVR